MPQHTCGNCHWWFPSQGGVQEMPMHVRVLHVCVLHTGLKTAELQKVNFGGDKPIRTTADFGCTEWMKDERRAKQVEADPDGIAD